MSLREIASEAYLSKEGMKKEIPREVNSTMNSRVWVESRNCEQNAEETHY